MFWKHKIWLSFQEDAKSGFIWTIFFLKLKVPAKSVFGNKLISYTHIMHLCTVHTVSIEFYSRTNTC